MVHRIRRVVTGHDRDGKSIFIEDRKAPNVLEMASMPGVALTDLWRTRTSPASNSGGKDAAAGKIKLEPPASGTILRIVEFPPDKAWRKTADAKKAFASIGAGGAPDHASGDAMMHATASVDYIIVLKGEIYAIMDKGEKPPEGGRRADPTRHQSLLERAHRGAVHHRGGPDRRQAGRAAGEE